MQTSPNLALPYIMPSQAQSHVTHNEAIRRLDCLTRLAVIDRTRTEPPPSPAGGDRHIVAAPATGNWAGQEDSVAAFQDGAWAFYAPTEGWTAWCTHEAGWLHFDGADWQQVAGSGGLPGNPDQLGINATADSVNRLAVGSDASLFSHDSAGDHRMVINKAQAGDTASLVFQSGWSGRAELGLTGSDDFAFKVSADGTSFVDALTIDRNTGALGFPATNLLRDCAVNLYQDSGRFAGNGSVGIGIGAFSFPSYLSLYNSASVAGLAKFIHDNSSHGGAAGALNPFVADLVAQIRDPGGSRRYGNEFWVAQFTTGSGQAVASTQSGLTAYYCLYLSAMIRMPAMTYHVYLRALDGPLMVGQFPGMTIYLNGVEQAGAGIIDPADGWRSVMIHDMQSPRSSYGYTPPTLNLYAVSAGDRHLMACPALVPGIVRIDPDIGLIAGLTSWMA
ncbi:MAG: DUF2793 domain-containing protein [Roseitalea sp.]|nr:DUF2793 domain-containing protein [Roseitalea sp.]MBO6950902.1 DUF2793 domain-containing protein [Rhizobiaceae bacterium]MBO6591111.1 DUF2793 domain-containing protein [Roseitalea sp.]MBO6599631.1 DUF2793 domain-containing protein [Roseitalea sp.]MBO6613882.1 DUF2793 domain-containing protein [Roseitalea sp.]